jgi:NosR/NirI family nitrous oxide reductase transcriptional regulator
VFSWLTRYTRWLHTRWPAGTVEKLPEVREDGSTNVPGLFVSGDLTGIPLLKFSLDSGARAVRTISQDPALDGARQAHPGVLDLIIIGGGVSGMAAAMEAKERGLSYRVLEASEDFSTLVNFPRKKPIYTYPKEMHPEGGLQVSAEVKETLIEELEEQVKTAGIHSVRGRAERVVRNRGRLTVEMANGETLDAIRVLVAIGRSGDHRRLNVPGEDLDKVSNRLFDPGDFRGQRVLVVGGGDSALETAIALAGCDAAVTLSYRGRELSRPKTENREELERLVAARRIDLLLGTELQEIRAREVILKDSDGASSTLENDTVFSMIGSQPPLEFFRRAGVRIAGEMSAASWTGLGLFLLFATWLYNWKSGGRMWQLWDRHNWFPFNLPDLFASAGAAVAVAVQDPATLIGTLAISAAKPSFWYTVAYSLLVVIFGLRRMNRRRTPYVTAQTLTLMSVQIFPLFLLPEIILPLLHHNALLPTGLADALFPVANYDHGREFWRAYGLILAWPLNVYNIFTHQPLWGWIGIGIVQTLILIPLGIYYWGKGFYCGWICSCGALAETLGDGFREKMPHGPFWNRFNMVGQGILAIAVILLVIRIVGWVMPAGNWAQQIFDSVLLNQYKWVVDVLLAGIIGYGVYFWFSGRFWCRFFCPLAALMHIYARFSRFRILSEKKKCISCNVCTTVCHQGIDVMNFANRGEPMSDPECVRCSACVQSCPTGVLTFGQVDAAGKVISLDALPASPVQMRERE